MPVEVMGGRESGREREACVLSTDERRRLAVRLYLYLFIAQLLAAVGTFLCSGLAFRFGTGDGGGIPYYVGGFVIGGSLLISCLTAFRIYNKGPLVTECANARSDVMCAIKWHRLLSMVMFLGCVSGLAIVWMYGLCIRGDGHTCSYENNHGTNRALSVAIFCLGVVAVISSVISMYLFVKYGSVFGLIRDSSHATGVAMQYGPCQRHNVQNHNELLRRIQANINVSEILRQQLQQQRQRQDDLQPRCGGQVPPSEFAYDNSGFVPTDSPPPYSTGNTFTATIPCQPPPYSTLPTISQSIDRSPVGVSPHIRHPLSPADPPPAYCETSKENDV